MDIASPLFSAEDLIARQLGQFGTILADPPWQFMNRAGKMAPGVHPCHRLSRAFGDGKPARLRRDFLPFARH